MSCFETKCALTPNDAAEEKKPIVETESKQIKIKRVISTSSATELDDAICDPLRVYVMRTHITMCLCAHDGVGQCARVRG